MPELDWTIEFGPRFLYYLYRNSKVAQIRIGLPLRGSLSTNFIKWRSVGYVIAPTFQIDLYNIFYIEKLDLYFICTPTYLSKGVAEYFYQIDPQYQTTDRLAYDARAGFLGTEISLALKYNWGNKNLILGSQFSDFTQSVNSQGYLHRNSINWSMLIAFSWLFFESKERALK